MRGWLRFVALLMAAIVVLEVALAAPIQRRKFLRGGSPRMATRQLREDITANPDDPALHALLGEGYGRMALYADCAGELQFARGNGDYESIGWRYHADALRYLGQPEVALAMRMERRWFRPELEVEILLGGVEDLRIAGDLDGAEALAREAVGAFPTVGGTHAWLADVLLDQGEREEALHELLIAEQDPEGSSQYHLVQMRLALEEGWLMEADRQSRLARRVGGPTHRIMAARAEVLRQLEQLEEALWMIDRQRYEWSEHPDMLLVRARILADLGRDAEARDVLDRAAELYPELESVRIAAGSVSSGDGP